MSGRVLGFWIMEAQRLPDALGANSTFLKDGTPCDEPVFTRRVTVLCRRTCMFGRLSAGAKYATAELLRAPFPTVDWTRAGDPNERRNRRNQQFCSHMPVPSPAWKSSWKGNSAPGALAVSIIRWSRTLGKSGKLTSTGPKPCTSGMTCPVVLWPSCGGTRREFCRKTISFRNSSWKRIVP